MVCRLTILSNVLHVIRKPQDCYQISVMSFKIYPRDISSETKSLARKTNAVTER